MKKPADGMDTLSPILRFSIGQQLLLRGSNDFDSVEGFQRWLDKQMTTLNRRCDKEKLASGRAALRPLPPTKGTDYEEMIARVASTCSIIVKRALYTVPSRLIGEQLRVHLYARHLSLHLGSEKVLDLTRVFAKDGHHRVRSVDFRHVIDSLVKKPQAFRHSILRDDLLPNDQYRAIWHRVDGEMDARFACKYIVKVLHIAAKGGCVRTLGDWLSAQEKMPDMNVVQQHFLPVPSADPQVTGGQHDLDEYDGLIGVQS
ncbi:MAG: hypothetical protein Q9M27_06240 [Mariprofundaceae bacterium]|nr:hypothetical protein [Mariprofundaceae bacterium]